jgi:deoxycytidine triphosphate deaminase
VPSQDLRAMALRKEIFALEPIADDQFQPASLDLRLGPTAYRVRASFLPGKGSVKAKLDEFAMHAMDITGGGVLEKGCVYIIPLLEGLDLRHRTSAMGNPKSSTGRLDIFTRLITDNGTAFDQVKEQYSGMLYAEVSPRTFSVLVRKGSRLSQLRVRRGKPIASDGFMRRLQQEHGLVQSPEAETGDARAVEIVNGVPVRVDLQGRRSGGIIGYKARSHAGLVDIDRIGHYEVDEYWEPVRAPARGGLILDPAEFYILASQEAVRVPARLCRRDDRVRHPGRRVPRPLRRLLRPRLRPRRRRRRGLARRPRGALVRGAVRPRARPARRAARLRAADVDAGGPVRPGHQVLLPGPGHQAQQALQGGPLGRLRAGLGRAALAIEEERPLGLELADHALDDPRHDRLHRLRALPRRRVVAAFAARDDEAGVVAPGRVGAQAPVQLVDERLRVERDRLGAAVGAASASSDRCCARRSSSAASFTRPNGAACCLLDHEEGACENSPVASVVPRKAASQRAMTEPVACGCRRCGTSRRRWQPPAGPVGRAIAAWTLPLVPSRSASSIRV